MEVLCSFEKEDIKFIKLRAMDVGIELEDEQKKRVQKVGWEERKNQKEGMWEQTERQKDRVGERGGEKKT